MNKIRFQMFIDEPQKYLLEQICLDLKIPIAEIIRRAINLFLDDLKKKKSIPSINDKVNAKITEKLCGIAGICKNAPSDLADNHDIYLYKQVER